MRDKSNKIFTKKINMFKPWFSGIIVFAVILSVTGCSGKAEEARNKNFQNGIKAVESSNYAGAIKNFDKALNNADMKVGDEEEDICCYKAAAQYLNGDAKGAVDTVSGLIKLRKGDADYYFLRGSYYASESKFDDADKDYKKVIELTPKDYDIYFTIYENLTARGQNDMAASYLKSVLASKDNGPKCHIAKGRVYIIKSDYAKAKVEFKYAVDRGNNEGYLWLAKCCNTKGESNAALEYIDKYSQKEKRSSESYNAIAEAEMALKNYNDAEKNIEKALKEKDVTNKQDVLRNQIICLENLGKFDKAKSYASDYIKSYPTDRGMLDEWQFLSTR